MAALVLDMGELLRKADVARRLVSLANRDSETVVRGLRSGERLPGDLLSRSEDGTGAVDSLTSHIALVPLEIRAGATIPGQPRDTCASALHDTVSWEPQAVEVPNQ